MSSVVEQSQDLQQTGGALSIESRRAMEEIQGAMTIAQRFPRDWNVIRPRIEAECSQPLLAEASTYSYPRKDGGKTVIIKGPSIRLIEVFLRNWQNVKAGWREIGRSTDPRTGLEIAEVDCYAWDLQTMAWVSRGFRVTLARFYSGGGVKPLTDARDQYELIANYAQRRTRSCVEAIVPRWAIVQALDWCQETKEKTVQLTDDSVNAMLKAFADKYHVTREQIEQYLGHPATVMAMNRREFVELRNIFTTIKEGEAKASEFFGGESAADKDPDEDLTRQVREVANGHKNGAQGEQPKAEEKKQEQKGNGPPSEADVFKQLDAVLAAPGKYTKDAINELAALADAISAERAEEFRTKLGQANEAISAAQAASVQGAFFQ